MGKATRRVGMVWAGWMFALLAGADEPPTATLRDGFEGAKTAWRQEETDTAVDLIAHDRTDRARREGVRSEHFKFVAKPGSTLFYSYKLPKLAVAEGLKATLYLRSNQSGLQLLGRVVLPADKDPETGEPSFVTVQGTTSDMPDRWQKLTLEDLPRAVERQARILRSGPGSRPVKLDGAYLERLVLNLYGGPGESEVFLDDLSISPVPASAVAENRGVDAPAQAVPIKPPSRVGVAGGRLMRDGLDWVPFVIQAPGADLKVLRELGPDVLSLPIDADPSVVDEAKRLGFLFMPSIGDRLNDPAAAASAMDAFPGRDAVAFWDLGDGLGRERDPKARKVELERVRDLERRIRERPEGPGRLVTGLVDGQLPLYAQSGRSLDLIGVRPLGWGTTQEPRETYAYFGQRRSLTTLVNGQAPFLAWVSASADPAFQRNIWGQSSPPEWGVPQVQPEQLRIYVYAALAAGYRAIGIEADASLTTETGRALRAEIAILRAEIALVESVIARGADPIAALPAYPPDVIPPIVYNPLGIAGGLGGRQKTQVLPETPAHPSIKVASIGTRDGRSRLLVVGDFAGNAQWQPPQMAVNDLKIIVPAALESAQAWEISLGEVKLLERERIPGGIRLTVPEFGNTSLILLTGDLEMKGRIEAEVRRIRPFAIPMAINQAIAQYDSTLETHNRLAREGIELRDAEDKPLNLANGWFETSREKIKAAQEALAREGYELAWNEARVATRPLRLIMRNHWEQAERALAKTSKQALGRPDPLPSPTATVASRIDKTKPVVLTSPVSSPPLTAFNTLPQHYRLMGTIRDWEFGRNLLPGPGFVDKAKLVDAGWDLDAGYRVDGLSTKVNPFPRDPKTKVNDALMLRVYSTDKELIDRQTPFQDFAVAAAVSPPVAVKAKNLVRIRVLVKMPRSTPPGAGGLIVRDSLGGESLQYRTNGPIPSWQELVLYRTAPADGEIRVMLGLAGLGEAYFADLKVEALAPSGEAPGEVARSPKVPSPTRR